MLTFLGFLTVALMLALILLKKLTPTVALIAVPLVTGIISCAFCDRSGRRTPICRVAGRSSGRA